MIIIKSEIRNPNVELNPNVQCLMTKQMFRHSSLGIRHLFVILVSSFVIFISSANAQPISSTDLINNARDYDGKEVSYQGEVIGDVMQRGDFVWVNINDSKNAIGIWLPRELAKPIIYTGSFKYRGDWVEVQGVFNRACKVHGGDLDIHAARLIRIEPGRPLPDRISGRKIQLAVILFGVLLCLLILQALRILLRQKSNKPKT